MVKERLLIGIFAMALAFISPLFVSAAPKQEEKKQSINNGAPTLWHEPIDLTSRDLFLGPGGESMTPDLSSITFIEEDKSGSNKKYRVKDGAGREWVVKLGQEAQSETAAVRLLWAVGYVTEINYLVPHVAIPGKGEFDNVRFEARPKGVKRVDEWPWARNPFNGTREFQGLKVMMLLFNNWDIKDSNNRVVLVPGVGDKPIEAQYIISDLGATFGKTGGKITRSRNKPHDYSKSDFVEKVKNSIVSFKYNGKMHDVFDDITVEQAKWIGGLLSNLSDKQIQDAFRAGNYSSTDIELLAGTFRDRINELIDLP
ncbi:MAG: hypothetical protein QOH96_3209 [Blastocatellia bacterium]|nr:hypothetical protein [Blastocatellia bacterium]